MISFKGGRRMDRRYTQRGDGMMAAFSLSQWTALEKAHPDVR
jgi:hypothetical protein